VRVTFTILQELIDNLLIQFSDIASPTFQPPLKTMEQVEMLGDRVRGVTLFPQ
jgi:hypothetical protein